MGGWLKRWLGGIAAPGARRPAPEGAAAPGVGADERLEDLYEEFCRTVCVRPGVRLMEFLEANGVTRLAHWLRPSTPCALPKAFIRLAVAATRQGHNLWEKPGLTMYYQGNWREGGGLPPQESQDALSVLAQVMRIPIKMYYTEREDGPMMVMTFEP